MNYSFTVEKRGALYVAVMDYPERKKGTGTVFYSNSNRVFVQEWCIENQKVEEKDDGSIESCD